MKSWALPPVLISIVALASLTIGCRSERLLEPDPSADGGSRTAAPLVRAGGGETLPKNKEPTVRFVRASEGDVADLVKTERTSAERGRRSFLVYVGATWCEPCQKFHEAALRGDLDRDLPPMTLLEFDADRDMPRLRAAGYSSTYIPLFVLPGADGRGSGRFIEGGIKGEGAAQELAPRLKKLLGSG